ncbi:MAG: hypothetical protein NTU53_03585 [Planctomycetota bacterium]|nr:hypothetical protein [Planctomycetota bacterium]
MISRDEIILEYLERLPDPPYPVQEEAMYAWAACEHGLLLSAPTGTGKTLVAEAAVYEGLRTGKGVYYRWSLPRCWSTACCIRRSSTSPTWARW